MRSQIHIPVLIALNSALIIAMAGCAREPTLDELEELAAPSEHSIPTESGNRANVLLITIDTLRADHLTPYGYAAPTSPAIAALAAEGVLFENAFSPRGATWPALASLMTGKHPVAHGVRKNGMMIDPKNLSLAEIFSKKGYDTAAELNDALQRWQARHHWRFLEGIEMNVPDAVREQLESLGYVF